MLQRKLHKLPEYIYPPHEWRLVEKRFAPRFLPNTETLFSTANGYLGIRGTFEEDDPVVQDGTFLNGFYESWPIAYGEEAYGFAKTGQTLVSVPESKIIRLYVDDEPFYLPVANLLLFERALDMRSGTLTREILWETPAGKQVYIKSERLASFEHRHLAAMSYEVMVLNAGAPVIISSEIVNERTEPSEQGSDPRIKAMSGRVLVPRLAYSKGRRVILGYSTERSKMTLGCGIDHTFETDCPYSEETNYGDDFGQIVFSVEAKPSKPIRLTKFITYHHSRRVSPEELCGRAERTLDRAVGYGYENIREGHKRYVDAFWQASDVRVEGDPKIQRQIRFNLFHILQAAGRAEGAGIPAKGLTGQGYEGHYFWDVEIYVLPFLIYNLPRIARNLLKFRYSMLDKARKRAREVNQKGALFPWRTINGDEASAYYAAGTAQYHINADIVYALRKYVDATGDVEFLYDVGVEILIETARLWMDLGFFSERRNGKFCIHGVTGPDEYNTVVDNNTYTNMMARENLWYAASTVTALKKERPERLAALVDRTGFEDSEVKEWKKAADRMYLPWDPKLRIHPQDDSFLDRKPWDFENTPPEKYPLLLHYHPLVIYRRQVIKQADVVLAMLLLGDEFALDQKKRNFDYYGPKTTGDSSLSVCVQSILASEVGYEEKALEYFRYAALMDLADVGGNVRHGAHIASMGGTWMTLVYGFAGMRDYDGNITFCPRLPRNWQRLRFPLSVRGQRIEVDMNHERTTYRLLEGERLELQHEDEKVVLSKEKPEIAVASSPARREQKGAPP